jgi:ABC-type amino acid transport substrate-binding protein
MSLCDGPRGKRGAMLLGLTATILIVCGLTLAAPAVRADPNQCAPAGVDSAAALPADLTAPGAGNPGAGPYTTPSVAPLGSVDRNALGLGTPGVLVAGTLSDAPPNACVAPTGQFSGFDNELLLAIAGKLGLQVRFVSTDFSALLAQVASGRFDVGSAAVKATDGRRRTVAFSNGYDFGFFSLVVPPGSPIHNFSEILRSGIQSVDPGQLEAARALGFSYPTAMRLVVVPQGVRRVLPALVNQLISLLKASALVYFLGLVANQRELFQVGRDLNSQTGNLSPLVAAGLFYLMLTVPLTHLVNVIDTRLRSGGRSKIEPAPAEATPTLGGEIT